MKFKMSATFFNWLAMFWSYALNHSIGWAILHFFFGVAYVAYRIIMTFVVNGPKC